MKHPTFPSLGQAALIVVALILCEYLAMAALHDALGLLGSDQWYQFSGIATVLGNGLVFSVLVHYQQMRYGDLFHSSASSVRATLSLLMVPVAMLVPALVLVIGLLDSALSALVPVSASQEAMFQRMTSVGVTSIVSTCILAPVLEEMLFRGIFLRSFLALYERRRAMLASALLFGAAHMNIYQFVTGLVMGCVLAWLYERSRSLVPCIALHAMFNIAVVVLSTQADAAEVPAPDGPGPALWIAAAVSALLGGAVLWRILGRGGAAGQAEPPSAPPTQPGST